MNTTERFATACNTKQLFINLTFGEIVNGTAKQATGLAKGFLVWRGQPDTVRIL